MEKELHNITDTHEIVYPTEETEHSPVIQGGIDITSKDSWMTFFKAMEFLATGSKIHKLEWEDEEFYGILSDGKVMLHKPDGKLYQWIISDGDLTGDDYVVIK